MRALLIAFVGLMALAWAQAQAQDDALTRYLAEVRLDPQTRTLAGTLTIDYVNDTGQPLESVPFLLLANLGSDPNPYVAPALLDEAYPDGFDPSWTVVRQVRNGAGEALDYAYEAMPPMVQTYSLEQAVLRVRLREPLGLGVRTRIVMDFETKFPHSTNIDATFYRNTYTWRFGWHPIVVGPTFFSDHRLVLEAAWHEATITLPQGFVLAAGADHQTVLEAGDGWQTIALNSDAPARSIPLAISPDFQVYTLRHATAPIEIYYLPGHASPARLAASLAATQIDAYQERFGPYGYGRLVIVDNPGPQLYGMAADGMVLLGTDNFRFKDLLVPGLADRFLEWLIAHEVGHLWWGIGVGADFNAENWLSEGLAQYLSLSYFEDAYGAFGPNLLSLPGPGMLENLIKGEFGYLNLRQHQVELSYLDVFYNRFDEAIVKRAEDVEYGPATAERTYNKGYLVLRALEGLVGRPALEKALRAVYAQNLHKTVSVAQLQAAVEAASGKDLEGFFQSWLYGDDFLDVAVTGMVSSPTDTQAYATEVKLSKRGEGAYPVTVRLTTRDGQTQDQVWDGAQARATLLFNGAAPAASVTVDPEEFSPDVDRANNHHPRKLVAKWGQSDFPLDAYFVRLDPTGARGQLGLKHAWAVTVVPRLETAGEDKEAPDFKGARLLLDGVAAFAARLDRGLSLGGTLNVSGYALDAPNEAKVEGEIGLNGAIYEHPATGSPSKFWVPANRLRLSLGVLGKLNDPVGYLGLGYTRLDELTLGMRHQIDLRVGLLNGEPFARGAWSGALRLRLTQATYLDLASSAGAGWGPLPEPLKPGLDGLHRAFAPAGRAAASGRVALVLPPMRGLNFSLLNLAIAERATLVAFVQGGRSWDENRPPADALEVGVQVQLGLSLPLGFPLDVTLGYAHPLRGEKSAGGELFAGISSVL